MSQHSDLVHTCPYHKDVFSSTDGSQMSRYLTASSIGSTEAIRSDTRRSRELSLMWTIAYLSTETN